MTLWQRIKSWFGFKPKAVPSKFGSSYDFNDDHWINAQGEQKVKGALPFPTAQGINNASTKSKPTVIPPVQRSAPVRSYGESECSHNYSARIGGVTTSSLRPDGSFADGVLTGYLAGEVMEAIGDMISGDRDQGFTETRSAPEPAYVAPEPAYVPPTPSTSWNDSGSTNWGDSGSTKIDGGSSWGSDISDAVSSVFSD